MEKLKKYLPDLLAVVLFAFIAFAYFMPADLEGRILYQHDTSAGRGAGQEALEYLQKTGERTRWTNSTFSGMPTYQTSPSYKSTDVLTKVMDAYHLWLPENVWYVFVYLLGFYILMRAFDFRRELAVLGSLVWAFSSYFFIIIAAGHIWKVWALAYLPPMIAGIVLAYRGKYLWGFILTALFAAFEVKANHVQMTYYYLFVILLMAIAFIVQSLTSRYAEAKGWKHVVKATAVCLAAAAVGICINLSNLYHTWEYSKETMRGKSELVKPNTENQTSSGLERDYITQWSYGIGETWTLLVPNTKGGASVPLARNEKAMEKADANYLPIYQQIGQYWGEQPMTSGPVYVGAFVLMLFILGIYVVKGPMKWALLIATILSIMLSWGKNFMGLTDFFIDNVPMYAKFRTVASILVIAEFTIPLLAMMALGKVLGDGWWGFSKTDTAKTPTTSEKYQKPILVSYALTAGACVLFALMPRMFFGDFVSTQEMNALSQFPPEQLNPLLANLREVRQSIFTADCWRSFLVITIGAALLLWAIRTKQKSNQFYAVCGMALLCLIDMWSVNKRYLNDDMFVEKSVREMPQEMTATDRQILEDKSLDYRVLNLASNTFNENETSYYHKSIGGYHAAKLRRYQELIEAHIAPEMQKMMPAIAEAQGDMTQVAGDSIYPVLNMLNMKYVIMPLQGGQTVPIMNPYAYGNAWFVDKLVYVKNANEEIENVGKVNLRHVAVADQKFKEQLGEAVVQDTASVVTLTAYEPNELKYNVRSGKGGVVVFSEIYYPGWTATVDGEKAELGRVNYVLRAMNLKPGEHEVVLTFKPQSLRRTETVAYVASLLLLLAVVGGIVVKFRRKNESVTKQ
ncbi:MAG: YfhO family protein [Prevotella sp.]|nr:YfhO family protein [Prevotella sp.]